ncbi:MAG: caspase family protein [Anaerolineae bacterium]|nr:caspase family protein [Anaerolineae bacterium]
MNRAMALLVGLTRVDSAGYHGWDGVNGCWGCELDVDNMAMILRPLGYEIAVLKTAQATARNVLDRLKESAEQLERGDIFVFYFSGHGGQQPDPEGDELDGQDETLIAYDRPIVDDELDDIWIKMAAGVRLVMLSDSCNSGTNYRSLHTLIAPTPFIPLSAAVRDASGSSAFKAQMIHMGGCRDGFSSVGYRSGGVFTQALCNIWQDGRFQGNYPRFYQQVCERITGSQRPQYNTYGPVTGFQDQRPFTVVSPDITREPGKKVAFRVRNGRYICIHEAENAGLFADCDRVGDRGTFDLIELGRSQVALRACNKRFVCAEGGGGQELAASRDWIRSWETFELIELGSNKVALRASNGRFLCAEQGGGHKVVANRWWIRSWETLERVDLE